MAGCTNSLWNHVSYGSYGGPKWSAKPSAKAACTARASVSRRKGRSSMPGGQTAGSGASPSGARISRNRRAMR